MPVSAVPNVLYDRAENASDLFEAKSLEKAQEAFYRHFNHAQGKLNLIRNLGNKRAIFDDLIKPANKKGPAKIFTAWQALKPNFLFSDRIVNPALAQVAYCDRPVFQFWKDTYANLDAEFNFERQKAALIDLRENVVAHVDRYMSNPQRPFNLNHIPAEKHLEWRQLIVDLNHEIAIRETFLQHQNAVAQVGDMLEKTSTVLNSTMRGVYRFTCFAEVLTPMVADPNDPATQNRPNVEKVVFDVAAKPTLHLTYVAAPTEMQAVTVKYDPADDAGKSVVGQYTENYSLDAPNRYLTSIKINVKPEDPLAQAQQIVDVAANYLKGCRKSQNGQPATILVLKGPNASALYTAFLQFGVQPKFFEAENGEPYSKFYAAYDIPKLDRSVIGLKGADPGSVDFLESVKEEAQKRSKEVKHVIYPEQGFVSSFFKTIPEQLDRPIDLQPAQSPQFQQLRTETVMAQREFQGKYAEILASLRPPAPPVPVDPDTDLNDDLGIHLKKGI